MPEFDDEYLPLALDLVKARDELNQRLERVIHSEHDDLWDSYLGSVAYRMAYQAHLADVGGTERTYERISDMLRELEEIETELNNEI